MNTHRLNKKKKTRSMISENVLLQFIILPTYLVNTDQKVHEH